MELYWSCSECGSANPYPGSQECEVCGKHIEEIEIEKVLQRKKEIENRIEQEKIEERKKIELAENERKKEEKRRKIVKRNKTKKFVLAATSVLVLIAIIIFFSFIQPAMKYSEAEVLMENRNYPAAIEIYESLYDYKDSKILIEECKEKQKEVNYQEAIKSFNDGNYEFARDFFALLGDYKDCKDYIGKCDIEALKESNKNDIVVLGEYKGTTIDWVVLEKNPTDVLLVSKYYIDSKIANEKPYGKYGKYTCWSGSTLRTWLNNTFVKEAFSPSVSEALICNRLQTNEYDVANYDGWNDEEITVSTEDRVYIPSISDIEKYNIKPTSLMNDSNNKLVTGWLRDRGHGIAFQDSFEEDGTYGSEWHFYSSYGIRPIICVSLNGETEIHNESYNEVGG